MVDRIILPFNFDLEICRPKEKIVLNLSCFDEHLKSQNIVLYFVKIFITLCFLA